MATAAAAVVARARRDVISHFMERNAVSPAAAVRWVPERALKQRILARFVRRGVIVQTAEDTYYLDVPAYDRWRRAMRKRTALLMGGVVAIGAILAAFA
jgi:CTP-dependent riboflavin kinase